MYAAQQEKSLSTPTVGGLTFDIEVSAGAAVALALKCTTSEENSLQAATSEENSLQAATSFVQQSFVKWNHNWDRRRGHEIHRGMGKNLRLSLALSTIQVTVRFKLDGKLPEGAIDGETRPLSPPPISAVN
ncbi:hypothetical protein TNCV_1136061 [Trichonephila clavipes]|nr:hypothetical protein TNCV_1136061 [Trichonephila clavipes]